MFSLVVSVFGRRWLAFRSLRIRALRVGRLAFGCALVGTGLLLVRVATVVGLIEARAFEHHRAAGAKQPPQLRLLALRALALGIFGDRLEQFELMLAGVANVIVSRHN